MGSFVQIELGWVSIINECPHRHCNLIALVVLLGLGLSDLYLIMFP